MPKLNQLAPPLKQPRALDCVQMEDDGARIDNGIVGLAQN